MARYTLALMVLAALALHTAHKIDQGLLGEMLWACHVASLGIGLGLLVGRGWPVAVGTVFHLAIGIPAYLLDVVVSASTTLTSIFVHTIPPAAGLMALRGSPWPRWTIPSAACLYFALIPLSRWLTAPELNVNLAFAPWKPVEPLLPAPWVSWLANGLLIVCALFAVVVPMRRWKARHESVETPGA